MTKIDITAEPIFNDDEAARLHFERLRWPGGEPVCFHCGVVGEAKLINSKTKNTRPGLYYCRACEGTFTATMGTVMEDSHIPLRKWLLATHLMAASKKGVSAAQLQRMLGLGSYRTAWHMAHRIRECMQPPVDEPRGPMGGEGQVVEADETYYGRKGAKAPTNQVKSKKRGITKDMRPKRVVVALVERGGKARVFNPASADKATVAKIVRENVHPETRLHTDESNLYTGADQVFASHETVKHSAREYVRGDVHTNSAEGFFGVFKKGMTGVYQHCGEKYLARYLQEFEFRHNTRAKLGYNDGDRAALAIKGSVGRRLPLHQPKGFQAA
jgi:transposase-like protein